MPATITWTVEADFDGDGVYEEDLTGRVSEQTPRVSVSRGIDRSGAYQISQVTIGLDNTDGRYSPENTAGALYGLLEPGVKIRVKALHSAVTYSVWVGYVMSWESVAVEAGRVATAQFIARDTLDYLRAYDALNVLSSTSRDTDGALTAIFAALNIDAGLYSLDDGIQDLAFHFARAQNALGACMDVVQSEMGGYFWVNKAGVMRFESRASRVGGYGSPDATWGDGTVIVPFRAAYEYDSSELVTSVTVRAANFLVNNDQVEVLRFSKNKDNRPADSLVIAAGATYEAEIPYAVPVVILSEPVANVDYLANTAQDGSGTDKTSAMTVTVTNPDGSDPTTGAMGAARVKLMNTDAGAIYVTEFRLRGTTVGFAGEKPHFVAAKSIPGQLADRSVDIDLPFSDDTALTARDYSMALLRTHRYPVPRVHLTFKLERNNTIAANLLARELGDLVRYTDTALGASGLYLDEWLYIDAITYDNIFPGGHPVVSFILTPAYAYRNLDKIVYDLFTRDDAATLGTALKGGTWAESTGFAIASNKARPSSAGTLTPNLDLASADCVVEVSLSNMSADTDEKVGVVYRYVDTDNYWSVDLSDATDQVRLRLTVAGAAGNLATAAWTPTDTAELRVIVQGDRHRVWVDRKLVIDYTDTTFNTATRVGPFSQSTTVVDWDDFYAEAL